MRHATEQLASGALKALLTRYTPPARTTLAVYPSQRHISPALRAMVDVLVEVYEQNPLATRRY
jgi:DNA-binding transcriptional LysR family regulator